MQLELRYTSLSQQPAAAVCIAGSDPIAWLQEIGRWGVNVDDLEMYILPHSLKNPSPAGLFVIFPGQLPSAIAVLDPYRCVAGKLYIPAAASVFPVLDEDELKKILPWERQVFHPVVGFTGFEPKDRLSLDDLLQEPLIDEADWSFANPGLSPKPLLTKIEIRQPDQHELLQNLLEEIGKKPLSDIKVNDKSSNSPIEKFLNFFRELFHKLIFFLAKMLIKIWPKKEVNTEPGSPGKMHWLQRLLNWSGASLDEINRKRESELQRLLKLFKENEDEALRYAIPLDSPYMNRGGAPPSSILNRRKTELTWNQLGGGGPADIWDTGDHYHTLRSSYLKAAQDNIEKKDFRQAAYIYAHLLGDFSSAAKVLEQGGHYREAATFYKEHLKNIPAAAECLEKGGLYHEAIDLYKQLNSTEKVGDLYSLLSDTDAADSYYEKTVEGKLAATDHLEAGRILAEKIKDADRAEQTYLTGWHHDRQPQQCLQQYFASRKKEEAYPLEAVQFIYEQHTPSRKKELFLQVLQKINQEDSNAANKEAYRDIAYEIISGKAAEGTTRLLHDLRKFIPDDSLLASDCSRYTARKPMSRTAGGTFHLDPAIRWIRATTYRNQFLAVGIKDSVAHLVRGNWYGNLEYYSWTNPVKSSRTWRFITQAQLGKHILLLSGNELPVTRKNLLRNKYFDDALTVYCPVSLHKSSSPFTYNEHGEIVKLSRSENGLALHFHNPEGDLKRTTNCIVNESMVNIPLIGDHLLYGNGCYYTGSGSRILLVSETGEANLTDMGSGIRFLEGNELFTPFRLFVSTNKGCYLCKPSNRSLGEPVFFAVDPIPSGVTFLSAVFFVLVEKRKARLFEIIENNPVELATFETTCSIVAALPNYTRNSFHLLEENGMLTVCDYESLRSPG